MWTSHGRARGRGRGPDGDFCRGLFNGKVEISPIAWPSSGRRLRSGLSVQMRTVAGDRMSEMAYREMNDVEGEEESTAQTNGERRMGLGQEDETREEGKRGTKNECDTHEQTDETRERRPREETNAGAADVNDVAQMAETGERREVDDERNANENTIAQMDEEGAEKERKDGVTDSGDTRNVGVPVAFKSNTEEATVMDDQHRLFRCVRDSKGRKARKCIASATCQSLPIFFYRRDALERHLLQSHGLHCNIPAGFSINKAEGWLHVNTISTKQRSQKHFYNAEAKYRAARHKFEKNCRRKGMEMYAQLPHHRKNGSEADFVDKYCSRKLAEYDSLKDERMCMIYKRIAVGYEASTRDARQQKGAHVNSQSENEALVLGVQLTSPCQENNETLVGTEDKRQQNDQLTEASIEVPHGTVCATLMQDGVSNIDRVPFISKGVQLVKDISSPAIMGKAEFSPIAWPSSGRRLRSGPSTQMQTVSGDRMSEMAFKEKKNAEGEGCQTPQTDDECREGSGQEDVTMEDAEGGNKSVCDTHGQTDETKKRGVEEEMYACDTDDNVSAQKDKARDRVEEEDRNAGATQMDKEEGGEEGRNASATYNSAVKQMDKARERGEERHLCATDNTHAMEDVEGEGGKEEDQSNAGAADDNTAAEMDEAGEVGEERKSNVIESKDTRNVGVRVAFESNTEEATVMDDQHRLFRCVRDSKGRKARKCIASATCQSLPIFFYRRDALERHLLQSHGLHCNIPAGFSINKAEGWLHVNTSSTKKRSEKHFYNAEAKYRAARHKFEKNCRRKGMEMYAQLPPHRKNESEADFVDKYCSRKLAEYDSLKDERMCMIYKRISAGYEASTRDAREQKGAHVNLQSENETCGVPLTSQCHDNIETLVGAEDKRQQNDQLTEASIEVLHGTVCATLMQDGVSTVDRVCIISKGVQLINDISSPAIMGKAEFSPIAWPSSGRRLRSGPSFQMWTVAGDRMSEMVFREKKNTEDEGYRTAQTGGLGREAERRDEVERGSKSECYTHGQTYETEEGGAEERNTSDADDNVIAQMDKAGERGEDNNADKQMNDAGEGGEERHLGVTESRPAKMNVEAERGEEEDQSNAGAADDNAVAQMYEEGESGQERKDAVTESKDTRNVGVPVVSKSSTEEVTVLDDRHKLFRCVRDSKGRKARKCIASATCQSLPLFFYRRDALERHLLQTHGLHCNIPEWFSINKVEGWLHVNTSSTKQRSEKHFYNAEAKYRAARRKFEKNCRRKGMAMYAQLPTHKKNESEAEFVDKYCSRKLEEYDSLKDERMCMIYKRIAVGYEASTRDARQQKGAHGNSQSENEVLGVQLTSPCQDNIEPLVDTDDKGQRKDELAEVSIEVAHRTVCATLLEGGMSTVDRISFISKRCNISFTAGVQFIKEIRSPGVMASTMTFNSFVLWLEYSLPPSISCLFWVLDPFWVQMKSQPSLMKYVGVVPTTVKILFMPTLHDDHWTLWTVVNFFDNGLKVLEKEGILFMDPLNKSPNKSITTRVKEVVRLLWAASGRDKAILRDVIHTVKVPHQPNATDCGFYVMKCIRLVIEESLQRCPKAAFGTKNWFSHEDVAKLREELSEWVYSITGLQFN